MNFCSAVFFGVLITEEIDVIGDKGSGNKIHQNVTDCAKQVVLPNCLHATKVWDIPMYENVK